MDFRRDDFEFLEWFKKGVVECDVHFFREHHALQLQGEFQGFPFVEVVVDLCEFHGLLIFRAVFRNFGDDFFCRTAEKACGHLCVRRTTGKKNLALRREQGLPVVHCKVDKGGVCQELCADCQVEFALRLEKADHSLERPFRFLIDDRVQMFRRNLLACQVHEIVEQIVLDDLVPGDDLEVRMVQTLCTHAVIVAFARVCQVRPPA